MSNSIKKTELYKGHTASYSWHEDEQLFHGRLNNMAAIVSIQGKTITEFMANFKVAVDDYEAMEVEF